ncbi:unnamed protein product, partial [Musa textilis]
MVREANVRRHRMGKLGAGLLFPVLLRDAVLCTGSALPSSPSRRIGPGILVAGGQLF